MKLKHIYLTLLASDALRPQLRKLRARIQYLAGYSDPYFDLVKISHTCGSKLLLDIGCHHGQTTKRLIEAGLPCPVVAIDPLTDNLAVAKGQLKRWPQVSFVECAVADVDGSSSFFVNCNEQTSSLLDNERGNMMSFNDETRHVNSISVKTATLESILRPHLGGENINAIIKVDAQGAEGKIICGGIECIKTNVAAFYCEVMLGKMYKNQYSFDDIRDLLEGEAGMVLNNIYPCLHDACGKAVQMDALWLRPDVASLICNSRKQQ
jgi:FkbM family methyltransferase